MKLCRFELLSQPGEIKSGMVYSGKIYETDGTNPVAVHEAEHIRPLAPIGIPPSFRIFDFPNGSEQDHDPNSQIGIPYAYGNPASLIGASQSIEIPHFTSELNFEPYLAVILAVSGVHVPVEEADDMILGFTIANIFVANDVRRMEIANGKGLGRSRDFATAIGPVISTPDELNDLVIDESMGKRYKMSVAARVNGVEVRKGDAEQLPYSFAEMISAASASCLLREGDLILAGPILTKGTGEDDLDPGDEIQIAVEKLGVLATRIAL